MTSKLNEFVKLFVEAINAQEDEMPKFLEYFFMSTEYLAYIIAALTILFTFFLSSKYLIKFFKNEERTVAQVLKVRLVIGHVLNLALSIILAGHVIHLMYCANLKTIFFIILITLVNELLVYFVNKQVVDINRDIKEYKKDKGGAL